MKLFNLLLAATFAITTANATPSSSRQITAQTIKNGAGVLTLPTSTDTLVGRATTDTLTNKTIDADGTGNVLSNIENADIKAAAAIDATKVANGSVTSTEFQYISTLTSDIQAQVTAITAAASSASEISNCSIASSVGGSALTIALKDGSGSDPSGGSACKIGFRSATSATGTYSQVSTTSAVSVVAANADSIGCPTAAVQCVIYVYAINNAGTVVLGMYVGGVLDEGSVQSSSALTGGADVASSTIWSTAAQASKAVRLLGRVTITPAAAFAWTNAASEVSNSPMITTPWYVNANLSGAIASLGVASVTSYTEITDASLTMTPISGSAPVGVMCSTTNAATAPTTGTSTCAAGSESTGANFAIPSPGAYEVCFQTSWEGQVDTAERVVAAFEVIETPTNAQTLTLEGGGRIVIGHSFTVAGGTDMLTDQNIHICGIFNWSTAAAGTVKGVRLMYEQSITGSVDASTILMDGSSNPGQYTTHIRARKL